MPLHPSRRELVAGAAVLAAAPFLPAFSASGDYDAAIVGAGAAGIAAANRIAASGKSCIVLEAASRPGGRVSSAVHPSGAAYEAGATRFSAPAKNPLVAIARAARLRVYDAPAGRRLYIGEREARDGEYDDFTSSLRRANRTIGAIADLGRDQAASRALPDLGDWQGTVSFVLGPLTCGKNLEDVSTVDLSRLEDRPDDVMVREGTAALLAAAVKPLTLELDTVVQRIDASGRNRIELNTSKGTLTARAVIVTASTNVLASGGIRFFPALPQGVAEALGKLSLGTYDRAVFELPGNPFRFRNDERVIFKTDDARSVMFHMRAGGSDLAFADLAGSFGRELSVAGEAAVADFVGRQFADHFGSDASVRINQLQLVRWSREPFVQGGFSAAAPGAAASRRTLIQPFSERIFLAGEAAHETMWGTVAGAALSGERAADQALRYLRQFDAPPAAPKKR